MITEWVMSPGDFRLRLRDDTPQDVVDLLDAWEHIVVLNQWVDPDRFTDTQMKALARWAGVLLELPRYGGPREFGGLGLALHLGDPDGVGDIYETAVTNTAETFPNWVRDLLPPAGSIVEGDLYSASGTLTATVQWVTPRQAIDWVCGQFSPPAGAADVEWRVNPDGSLDAGPVSDLYVTDPAAAATPCILVADNPGSQPLAKAVPVEDLRGQDEGYRQIIKQWVHGQGDGDTLITGSASVASNLKDYHGNDLVRTAVDSDSQASEANIGQRAGHLLREKHHTMVRWEADLAGFWVQGQLVLGDWVLIYDPAAGFADTANEIHCRGQRIWPEAIRVVGMSWAAVDGMGVYLRQRTGGWVDLTPYMEWEQPSCRLQLGDRPADTLSTDLAGEYRKKHYTSDGATPNPPTGLTVAADTYVGTRGIERAELVPSWTNPTLNTDGSTLVDLDTIRIRFRRNGTSEKWEFRDFDSDGSGQVAVRRVDPDTVYEVQAQARRKNRNYSTWTASTTVDTSHDTAAPGTPPTPTLDIASPTRITVTIDLSTYGPNNLDVVTFPIWGNTVDNSATATKIGRIPVTHAELAAGDTITARLAIPSGNLEAVYYIWLKARDDGGNLSGFSAVASATPIKINTAHIGDSQVTGPKLGDGDVVALLTLASTGKIGTAASGQRLELVATSSTDMLLGYSGLSGETAGRLYPYTEEPGVLDIPGMALLSPTEATYDTSAGLYLLAGTDLGSQEVRIRGLLIPQTADIYDLGSGALPFDLLYANTHYCDRGDGLGMVEVAPYGTLIPGGTGTHTTVGSSTLNGGSMAEIATVDITLEYANQEVIVDVFVSARVSGLTAGEWWGLRPYVQGVARGNSALTDIPASGAFSYSFLGQRWVGTVTATGTALTLSIQAQTQTSDATVDQVLIAYAVSRA